MIQIFSIPPSFFGLLSFSFKMFRKAGNVSTPSGSLSLCYDERGNLYEVPQFCYTNPANLKTFNERHVPQEEDAQSGETYDAEEIPIFIRLANSVSFVCELCEH